MRKWEQTFPAFPHPCYVGFDNARTSFGNFPACVCQASHAATGNSPRKTTRLFLFVLVLVAHIVGSTYRKIHRSPFERYHTSGIIYTLVHYRVLSKVFDGIYSWNPPWTRPVEVQRPIWSPWLDNSWGYQARAQKTGYKTNQHGDSWCNSQDVSGMGYNGTRRGKETANDVGLPGNCSNRNNTWPIDHSIPQLQFGIV